MENARVPFFFYEMSSIRKRTASERSERVSFLIRNNETSERRRLIVFPLFGSDRNDELADVLV